MSGTESISKLMYDLRGYGSDFHPQKSLEFKAIDADVGAIFGGNACAVGVGTADDTVTGASILSLHIFCFLSDL